MEEDEHQEQVLPTRRPGTGRGRTFQQDRPRGPSRITAANLRELVNEDPATILLRLSRPNNGLMDFLKRGEISMDAIKLVLSALSKACQCESMSESLNRMISEVLRTPFLDATLLRYLAQVNSQRHGDNEVVKYCLPLLKGLLSKMPTEGCIKVQVIAVMVQNLWQKGGMQDEDVEKGMQELDELLVRSQPPPPQVGGRIDPSETENENPPESFRELPIIPRKDELDGTVPVFLLPNKIQGGFRDLEHYLECQFRLFRADVIIPLKDSIVDFQTVGEDTSVGYRIYTDVQIVRPICTHNGLGYRLAFDTRPLRHVKWESSRRLIFGSLLCLSSDNFKENMLFATVDQRQKDLLKNGLVDVQFLSNQEEVASISRDTRFAMVESQAYFESYKYILHGMQELTERNFPFQQYIVECQNTIQEPLYLRQQQDFLYDLRPLLDDALKVSDDTNTLNDHAYPPGSEIANNVKIQDDSTWPMPDFLHLDVSQLTAMKNALTREFALIQGPPGTGKTYVGVKILKTLLHNSQIWRQGPRQLPILVVCYTNHALDQFLEATLQFFTGCLVRVGSRSKSELMQEHSLKNARQRVRELRSLPLHVHAGKLETLRAMDSLKADIHTTATKLEVAEREIVHERCLRDFMDKRFSLCFPSESEYQSCHILAWLGVQKQLFDIEQEGEYLQHQLEELRTGYEEEEDTFVDEETIDLSENRQTTRQLEEDIMDDYFDDEDDHRDSRVKTLDANVQSIRCRSIGLDVTNLDVSKVSGFMKPYLKDLMEEKQRKKKRLKISLMKWIRSTDRMTAAETDHMNNIWRMPYRQRWRLYRYWVDLLCRQAKGEIRDKEDEYRRLTDRYREILMQEDRVILQNCSIVGMTTTGAARYQKILNEIGPKIIIIEEAAEVLEAHVVGTLSRECQHLILIGDHQQLRPNPTVNKLAKRYNLEISLFERMVQNRLNCDTLLWQHRMRPEIAEVIRPLYPKLKDHEVVKKYDSVKGVARNVYFIEHQHPHAKNDETKSFSNEHEAKYMAALCKYLIKQGYRTDKITILTTYSAQMNLLKDSMPKTVFEGVRVVSVDSYQGEENDIVLLSLVRSGEESKIGFLAEDNRVCVALSRAKIGLYVIGNFSYITEHSPLLKDICTQAYRNNIMGPALPLACQNHPTDEGVPATDPRDFERVPEGGCTKPCQYRLQCGHVCPRMCHAADPEHKNVTCIKPCKRRCSHCNNITCTNPCYKPCSPCPIQVPRRLPRCGHLQNVECEGNVLSVQCEEPCPETLGCGHPCRGKCGEMHPSCTEHVDVTRPCGHAIQVACGSRNTAPCNKHCETILTCEHLCQGNCGTCNRGRLHHPCSAACNRLLICGHVCQSSCSNCPPCSRPCENRCNHSKCGKKCGDPCVRCMEECQWKCRHHRCTTQCGDMCDRPRCNDICRKKLTCGHLCIGVCGEPCPKLCRICNENEVTELFFGNEDDPHTRFIELEDCHHIFEMKGLDQYMDNPEDEDKTVVKLKGCPRCHTPIRRNLRYGNIIKQALTDIEKAKLKVRGNDERLKSLKDSITRSKNMLMPADLAIIDQLLTSVPVPSETILSTQNNQISIFKQLLSIERMTSESTGKFRCEQETYEPLLRRVKDFKKWVMLQRACFSKQEVEDTKREMEHLSLLKYLIDAREWIDQDKRDVPPRILRDLAAIIRQLESPTVLPKNVLDEARKMKDSVKEYVPGSGIGVTDAERIMIVEAIGLNKGHWYKCKRGHVYAIGECGRAYEEATCPECGGAIGGESHHLAEDNAWAPEMDEAEEEPWSEERDYLLALRLQFGGR